MDQSWYHDARFGMFIHWGLYAIPAGRWKGKPVKGIGEQIMRFAQIPAAEYEKLARGFNPIHFDADAWVKLAVRAGMKYLVLTTKHHDGFALFDSAASDFTVTKATPFGRDIVKELAEACALHGIRFCVYYSQRQDWHEPDGAWNEWPGQFPAPREERGFHFRRYCESKAFPQVRELLTNYGPIGLVWFDTPADSTEEDSRDFYDLVHSLQPDTLVCDRVGNGFGDYAVLGDNEFPYCPDNLNGEVPATMNHTWGFKADDHEWKSTRDLLYSLLRSVSCGCNYLLNIGPDALGDIPQEAVTRLEEIGEWLRINKDAVYGASAVPFSAPCDWGLATCRDNRLYLILDQWPQDGEFSLTGICNRPLSARLLGHDAAIQVERHAGVIRITGLPPQAPSRCFSVIELTLDGACAVDPTLRPDSRGNVILQSGRARPSGNVALDSRGLPLNFRPGSGALQWEFEAPAGSCSLEALTTRHWSCNWQQGIRVRITCDDVSVEKELLEDRLLDNLQRHYHPETVSELGTLTLKKSGRHIMRAEVLEMPDGGPGIRTAAEAGNDQRTLNLIQLALIPQAGHR